MAPLNEEKLNQIRDERKEQIMAAALKVFSRRGVVGTKMSMIVAEAGISHGLVYHYFKSKDELFITLVKVAVDGAQEAMSSLGSVPGSAIDKIRTLAVDMLEEDGALFAQLMHQARTSDGVPGEAKELINKYSLEHYIHILGPLFEEGQKDEAIAPGDPGEMAASFLTVLTGVMMMATGDNGQYRIPSVDMLMKLITK